MGPSKRIERAHDIMKFLKTISVEELKKLLEKYANLNLGEEYISIEEAFNRTLSRDIASKINVPHFAKARMDGYAVKAQDTFGADEDNLIELHVMETVHAGDIPQKRINKGECAYVATGAAVPEGADAVVMVEFTERKDDKVLISKAVTPETYIVKIGYDLKKDDLIITKGHLIDLSTIGVLAGCGIKEIHVHRKPIVSLMSTGDEIVPLETPELAIGKIYDINSHVLKQAIKNTGAQVEYLGIVKDNSQELEKNIKLGLEKADIVILSGGTSKGEGDLGPQVVERLPDIELLIHGVRIKPGKPLIFAKLKEKMVFILPGYPTSSLSCFYVFIENFLRRLSGLPLKEHFAKKYEVGERIYSTRGRHEFKTVKIREIDGVKKIFPINKGSEAITALYYADGYIEIEELENIIEKGEMRTTFSFL